MKVKSDSFFFFYHEFLQALLLTELQETLQGKFSDECEEQGFSFGTADFQISANHIVEDVL